MQKKQNDNLELKLACIVRFFREKRKVPPDLNSGNYCPHFRIKEDTRYLGVRFIEGKEVDFDTWITCIVSLLYEGVDYSGLVCGTEFHIMEGPNEVGEGIVDEICYCK